LRRRAGAVHDGGVVDITVPEIPHGQVSVPERVAELAGGDPVRPVWVNEGGGITFEVGSGPRRRFVKWSQASSGVDLTPEAARLAWAVGWIRVPRLLSWGADETESWLVTAPLAGEMAVTDRWKAEPATAVRAIGEGLRALHDTLPVAECPFSWSIEERVATAHRRAEAGELDPADWHTDIRPLGVHEALRRLADPPPIDELVVCHGDMCAPNTLIGDDGRASGHVDLVELGVADRWADLAIATWSLNWNYGPDWEEPLLDAYGIAPDPDRTFYYRLLWTLSS
jgi:aminoglycoside phosphotransferase